ncbi:MAG TPA: hypothetical protein VLV15_10770 [Dongiaceae bacterium]|nr:hypothetical protein [Dongiaceae bacterium]
MRNRSTAELAARLLLAWLAVSVLAGLAGHHLIAALLPVFTFVVKAASPELVPRLDIAVRNHEYMLELSFWTTRPIPLGDHMVLAAFSRFENAATHVSHTLAPATILLVPVLAWPARTLAEWSVRTVLALPLLLLLLAVTAPLLLSGRVELTLLEMQARYGASPAAPLLVAWVIFLESGGRWLLPIVGAASCIAAAGQLVRHAGQSRSMS